jgi:type 1 glutamine amidotransferase
MDNTRTRQVLVVRGGWEGHSPVEATERFIPHLKEHGFAVEVHDGPAVYADVERMATTDLVVQCYTQGEATDEQVLGLSAAVAAGTGLAGWHGGVCDSYRGSPDYLHLTGGQWAAHPGGFVPYDVRVLPDKADHELVAGLNPVWSLDTEQYWVLTDELNDVLATTTFGVRDDTPWRREVTCPAVWTRVWGRGRVFVSTIGHKLEDLDHPDVRTLTERGLLWASR